MSKREVMLADWLKKIGAVKVSFAELSGPSGDSIHTSGSIAGYMVNGQSFFVRRWDSGGWDIYVPASNITVNGYYPDPYAAIMVAANKALDL